MEDYAAVVNDEYESTDDLPTMPSIEFIGSRIFLELIQISEEWVGKRVTVFIFLFDEETGKFFPSPVAEATVRVLPTNKHWNRSLTFRGPKGSAQVQKSEESHRLPEGRYLLKFFCDVNEELKEDWEIPLMDSGGHNALAGSLEASDDCQPLGTLTAAQKLLTTRQSQIRK